MKWILRKSKAEIKPDEEGWFISWKNGKDEVEIIRYYDDDNAKWGGFEVWYQEEKSDKERGKWWDGEHLATFDNQEKAIVFAKKYIKKEWGDEVE